MTNKIVDADMLYLAKKGKMRQGKNSLVKYLEGGKITRKQAMNAKCYDCNGLGESNECNIESCSLYPYSPFKM
jgi:hypothetical protein